MLIYYLIVNLEYFVCIPSYKTLSQLSIWYLSYEIILRTLQKFLIPDWISSRQDNHLQCNIPLRGNSTWWIRWWLCTINFKEKFESNGN